MKQPCPCGLDRVDDPSGGEAHAPKYPLPHPRDNAPPLPGSWAPRRGQSERQRVHIAHRAPRLAACLPALVSIHGSHSLSCPLPSRSDATLWVPAVLEDGTHKCGSCDTCHAPAVVPLRPQPTSTCSPTLQTSHQPYHYREQVTNLQHLGLEVETQTHMSVHPNPRARDQINKQIMPSANMALTCDAFVNK